MHGVDHRDPERPPLDTDGCLAIPNEELLRLAGRLEPLVTPVIVAREMRWALPDDVDSLKDEFEGALDRWRDSLAAGDILAYLATYDDAFTYYGMDRADWAAWRLSVFESRRLDGVELRDVFLLADPEEPGLYLSRFTQVLATADGPVTTIRRLYWRRGEGNEWRIVAEDAG